MAKIYAEQTTPTTNNWFNFEDNRTLRFIAVNPSTLTTCAARANAGISQIREIASEIASGGDLVVGLNGSYARGEVTSGSDVDLFILVSDESRVNDGYRILSSIKAELLRANFKLASAGGVFDIPLATDTLCQTIGGVDDTNVHITRRMLLLLEGEWVYGRAEFERIRQCLIDRYVTDRIRDEQITLFLLNDVIRYWRTICVDYEHKIGHGKAAEIRLLKLRFSRMLLYMGGVVAVGMTYKKSPAQKRATLLELFAEPPAERIRKVMGESAYSALEIYDEFLSAIHDPDRRAALSIERTLGDEYTPEYQALRDRAKEFRNQLRYALEATFPDPHPLLPSILL